MRRATQNRSDGLPYFVFSGLQKLTLLRRHLNLLKLDTFLQQRDLVRIFETRLHFLPCLHRVPDFFFWEKSWHHKKTRHICAMTKEPRTEPLCRHTDPKSFSHNGHHIIPDIVVRTQPANMQHVTGSQLNHFIVYLRDIPKFPVDLRRVGL